MSDARHDYRHAAQRPALPAPFLCALALWLSCAAGYGAARMAEAALSQTIATSCIAIALGALAASSLKRMRMPLLVGAAVALGIALGYSAGLELKTQAQRLESLQPQQLQVTLEQDSSNRGAGERALVRLRLPSGQSVLCEGRFSGDEPRLYGDHLTAMVRVSPIDYSDDARSWDSGACAVARLADEQAQSSGSLAEPMLAVRRRAIEGIGEGSDEQGVLQALVCGYRRNISGTDVYATYQDCGLAHLVAVSGAHLVIVTGLVASCARALRLRKSFVIAVSIVVMISYLVLSGMPVSALRATVMSALSLLSLFGKRRPSSLNALGICMALLIALDPKAAVSVSFVLSSASTLGIVLFAPLVKSWLDETPLGAIGFIADALAVTLASSALSQLYATSVFSVIPLVSPLANIVAAPFFPPLCGLGLLAGVGLAFGVPFSDVLLYAASVICKMLDEVIKALASIPYASIPFFIDMFTAVSASVLVGAALWAFWPRLSRAAPVLVVAVALLAVIAVLPNGADAITMLDVGQGDAILVRSRGHAMLVDTGNQDALLKGELARNHVVHLDAVVITHADDDHFGSLDALAGCVSVDKAIVATDMQSCPEPKTMKLASQLKDVAGELVLVKPGDSIRLGAFTARVIWPHSFADNGGNADSLCLMLDYDGDDDGRTDHRALLTGDAEKEQLQALQEEGALGSVDILKVGHHGSRNAMTSEQARFLKPKVALIGVGAHNRYGHPTGETLALLEEVSCQTFRTDRDGEVACTLTPEAIRVRCLD